MARLQMRGMSPETVKQYGVRCVQLGCESGPRPVSVARWQKESALCWAGVFNRRSCSLLQPTLFGNKTLKRNHEMAFKGKAVDSKTVLLNLLLCLLIFYSLFYMIGSVCFGAFRLDHFDGLIPFDFKTEPTESNSKYLVNLLSLELTYFCSGLLFAAVVKRRVWDYALTVTLMHVMITSLVMLEFPTVWQWWLALGSGLFLMICNGQLIAYFTCQSEQSYASFSIY